MNPAEAMAAMTGHTARLSDATGVGTGPLQAAAVTAAGQVRAVAIRAGHSVSIRVLQRANGVRITVSGPQAHRYRSMINAELARTYPVTAAEVRAQITRKIR